VVDARTTASGAPVLCDVAAPSAFLILPRRVCRLCGILPDPSCLEPSRPGWRRLAASSAATRPGSRRPSRSRTLCERGRPAIVSSLDLHGTSAPADVLRGCRASHRISDRRRRATLHHGSYRLRTFAGFVTVDAGRPHHRAEVAPPLHRRLNHLARSRRTSGHREDRERGDVALVAGAVPAEARARPAGSCTVLPRHAQLRRRHLLSISVARCRAARAALLPPRPPPAPVSPAAAPTA